MQKQCSRCKTVKMLKEFAANVNGLMGHHSICKECKSQYHREWFEKNREDKLKKNQEWKKENAAHRTEVNKKWTDRNREKVNAYARKSIAKRLATVRGRINDRISSGVYQALRENKKGWKWESLVGYTVDDLHDHLESRFAEGMSWDLFMDGDIHIDHVIPKSYFKYESHKDKQFKRCWGLSNLQPLWASDNLRKYNNFIG